MRIGVDYDGVLSDPSLEKIYFARYYYGRQLRPEDCTTSKAAPILDPNGKEKYVTMYKILERALVGIEGFGGGHEFACGANVKKRDFKSFVENIKSELKPLL